MRTSSANNVPPSLSSNYQPRLSLDRKILQYNMVRPVDHLLKRRSNSPASSLPCTAHDPAVIVAKALHVSEKSTSRPPSIIKPSPAKRKRRVGFNNTVRFVTTLGLHQYTEEEIRSTYYSTTEFAEMKAETRSTVKIMRRLDKKKMLKSPFDPNEVCFRGLEHLRSTEILREIQAEQRQVIGAVLYAQDQRRQFGAKLSLSDVSKEFSRPALTRSLNMGTQDALEVMRLPS